MFTGLILSGILAAVPQLPSAGTPPAPAVPEPPERPFAHLFAVTPGPAQPEVERQASPSRRTAGPRRKVVCGMTLLFVGPDADPGMAKPAPKDGVVYTMRRVPPPVCGKDE